VLRLAPIFEDGNYLNRPPRGFDRSSRVRVFVQTSRPDTMRGFGAASDYKFYKTRESHLSTLLYIFSSSAHHFPSVLPALLGRPRPPRADRSRSGFIQGQRAPVVLLSRPSTRPERGNHGPSWFVARSLTKIINYWELWKSRLKSSEPIIRIMLSTVLY
jgi:hypothetical protein